LFDFCAKRVPASVTGVVLLGIPGQFACLPIVHVPARLTEVGVSCYYQTPSF